MEGETKIQLSIPDQIQFLLNSYGDTRIKKGELISYKANFFNEGNNSKEANENNNVFSLGEN
jgi:hypothetical protein